MFCGGDSFIIRGKEEAGEVTVSTHREQTKIINIGDRKIGGEIRF